MPPSAQPILTPQYSDAVMAAKSGRAAPPLLKFVELRDANWDMADVT